MLHLGRLCPHSQTLDEAGKTSQEQPLKLITNIFLNSVGKSFITLGLARHSSVDNPSAIQ
jgi:hypothetical protein